MTVELTSAAEVFDLLDSKTNDPIIRVLRGQVSDSLLITTAYAIIADRKDRALISPAGEVSGWQPIETAPRDAVLLLYGEIGHGRTAEHPRGPIRACGYWDDIDQAWAFTETTWEGPFMNPTHWMPLAEAPGALR